MKTIEQIFSRAASVLLLALVGIGLAACAANKNLQPVEATPSGAGGFDLADANHDGKLSRNEASDFLVNEIFNARDANHDSRLTLQEWSAGDPKRKRDFRKSDTNHDGIVTKAEATVYGRSHGVANKMLREADKNGDGKLDRAEVQAYYASREAPPR
jgi:Ca2+-binding EF-hand superfamily protein